MFNSLTPAPVRGSTSDVRSGKQVLASDPTREFEVSETTDGTVLRGGNEWDEWSDGRDEVVRAESRSRCNI